MRSVNSFVRGRKIAESTAERRERQPLVKFGVIGLILPIIERVWLRSHLEPDTVTRHDQIDRSEERGPNK
jgi:hypothetical protein